MKFLKSLLFFAAMSIAIISCSDDKDQVVVNERPDIDRKIDYTILVVAGETSSSLKSANGANLAKVTVSVNGSTVTKTTDVSGQATFNGLTAGTAAVTVTMDGHTTVNYLVDLHHTDTVNYDNEKSRIAASKVVLLPTSGTGMVTLTGQVRAQLNIAIVYNSWSTNNSSYTQSPELENVPAGTIITATIDQDDLENYVTMEMGGEIISATYENVSFTTTVDANGNYSFSLPSTAQGLNVNIYPNKFESLVTYSAFTRDGNGAVQSNQITNNYILQDKTQRNIFSNGGFTVKMITGKNEIQDIIYSNPIITDVDYFGSNDYQD